MEQLKGNLLQFNRKTITIDELEKLIPQKQTYEQFATKIVQLENEKILEMIQSKGRNSRTPSLAFRYRIRKQRLNETYHKELQAYRIQFHNAINLDTYFKLDAQTWKKDLPYIKKINEYIERHGFPVKEAPAPERSFELVGNEKWIEQTGEELLQRINLWDVLKVMPVADPLMFALNPAKIGDDTTYHIIVENKTTYQALLPVLSSSIFATLIYGAGNKIVKSIENFANQYPTEPSANQHFFYFGDIDREGINIWHRLNEKHRAIPAQPFYEACLSKEVAYGKTNQIKNKTALHRFLHHFPETNATIIENILEKGAYYPQEVLKTEELQRILLSDIWIKQSQNLG